MFRRVLIANRGEIALRVVQACRDLGIEAVGVHSTADEESLHVAYCDESVCIGPPASGESYLNISSIVAAAEVSGADAVHPGYGFLAENARFAEVLQECNLNWIGPTPDTIRLMGDKARARRTALAVGVPVLPGSEAPVRSAEEAVKIALEVGFPVILKASAGGGGRGMRVVHTEEELPVNWRTAREEAAKAFGDGPIYLEKFLTEPRHIEFQILGDQHGVVIYLGERECSIQRRHQKLIEEAPSPAVSPELRAQMGEAAVRLASAVEYEGAGTVEFLLDVDGKFYFMEMNTRIQVEHPVTEMVTGMDLVKWQIRIAAGERMKRRKPPAIRGHAIECRVNAEHPETFRPSPGRMTTFHAPGGPGIRVDTHGYEGYVIPPYYDSLVAKLVAHGENREEAMARMLRALDFFVIEGIDTTIPLHKEILQDPDFRRGAFSTRFMEVMLERKRQEGSGEGT